MSKDTISYGSYDAETDKRLSEAASAIKREAKKDGAFFARKNRPTLNEPSLAPYVGRYRSAYNEVLAKEVGKIKPDMHEAKFIRFKEETTRKEKEIDTVIEKRDYENQLDARALDGKPCPKPKKYNPFAAILLGFIYAGEMYYNALAFAFLGGNMLGAYLIGMTVTIIAGILAYAAGRNLARMEGGEKNLSLQTGLFILINLGIVIAMSTLRARMLDSTTMHTPVWVFFLVNIAFLAGSIVFSRLFVPSEKQKDADRETIDRHQKIKAREEEIKKLSAEKTELQKALQREEENYLFVMSQVRAITECVEAHYHETVEVFKTENLITRSDLGTPISFFEPTTSLFTTKQTTS